MCVCMYIYMYIYTVVENVFFPVGVLVLRHELEFFHRLLPEYPINGWSTNNKILSQEGYSSTKYSARKDIPVQNIKSVRIFQYKIFSQEGYSRVFLIGGRTSSLNRSDLVGQ